MLADENFIGYVIEPIRKFDDPGYALHYCGGGASPDGMSFDCSDVSVNSR
jgi:hypothetical protein